MVAPVVLIAFNRPYQTQQVLDRIRDSAPEQLFLIVDAPRSTHPADDEKCAAVRAILETIDWPCHVERRYADTNLGCAASIELGLDWVFSKVPYAIVLEDDCLADPTFFPFCTELLERYADDERFGYIGGAAPRVADEVFGGHSYTFAAFASIWGWASWARAWRQHRALYPRTHAPGDSASRRTQPIDWDDTQLVTRAGRRFFRSAGKTLDNHSATWAIHWVLSVIATRSFAITASTVLVQNVGLGTAGTHTQSEREMPPTEPMKFPLRHPDLVAVNEVVEAAYEKVVSQELGLTSRIARAVLPAGPLRALARRIHYRRTAS